MIKIVSLLAAALVAWTLPVDARETGERFRDSRRGEIYGRELMDRQEREDYREKMWDLKTEKERDRFRRKHHERMKERARDLGVSLPDDPVYLDRPYFEDGFEERSGGGGKSWPDDGLRRWTPGDEDEGQGGLRRWPDVRAESEDSRWPDDPLRRWPSQRPEVLRPDPADPEKPLPPGSGLLDPY